MISLKVIASVAKVAAGVIAFAYGARAAKRNNLVSDITEAAVAAFSAVEKNPEKEDVETTVKHAVNAASQIGHLFKGRSNNFFSSILYAAVSANKIKKAVDKPERTKSHVEDVLDAILSSIPEKKDVKNPADVTFQHWSNISSIVDNFMGTRGGTKPIQLGMIFPDAVNYNPLVIGLAHGAKILKSKHSTTFETLFQPYKNHYLGRSSSRLKPTLEWHMELEALQRDLQTSGSPKEKQFLQDKIDAMMILAERK